MIVDDVMGPNVKKLIIHKMSLDAILKGGGVADGIKFLSDPALVKKTFRTASEWVKDAIAVVRQAGEPNNLKESTDEDIALELLKKIEERKRAAK